MLRAIRDAVYRCGPVGGIAFLTQRFGSYLLRDASAVVRRVLWPVYRVCDLVFVRFGCSAILPADVTIGRNVGFPHDASGVVLAPGVVIGDDCVIFHQVTIGQVSAQNGGVPKVGDRVFVGAGAKILGPVTVGDDARVGANAVVLDDVPAGAAVVGNPARVAG